MVGSEISSQKHKLQASERLAVGMLANCKSNDRNPNHDDAAGSHVHDGRLRNDKRERNNIQ
jgi:hypothetical protein